MVEYLRGWIVLAALVSAGAGTAQEVAVKSTAVESAWHMVAEGKRPQAVALLRDLVKQDPRDADARLLLGSLLMEAGERSESIARLSEAVRLRPVSAEAHNALGEAYKAFGEAKSALPEFERAVALDPRHTQAQLNLGEALLAEGDASAAIPHLDRAIQLFGNKAEGAYARYLRAKVYSEQRETAKAASDLERAVALQPDFAEAWSDLGEARKNLGDDEGALAASRKVVELRPDDAVAQSRLGAKLLESGKAREAIPHLEEAVHLDPRNQSALNALMRALRQDGQTERSEAVKKTLAELLLARDRDDKNLTAALELNNRGAELEKRGDVKAALENYRAAAKLQPEHVGIQVNLAVALLKLGYWNEGIAQMRAALQRDPGNAQLKQAFEDAVAQARAHGVALPKQ
jgi:tetratricopeptide (TPR) repeat protein